MRVKCQGGNTTEPLSARLVTGQTRSDLHDPPSYTRTGPNIFVRHLSGGSPTGARRRSGVVRETDTFLELVAIKKRYSSPI